MTSLEITRTLPAPPARVWRAFTEPKALAAWFWPHLDNVVTIDLRPGGHYRIAGPKAGIAVSGEYVTVQPPELLVFTWQWEGESERSRVTVRLTPSGSGTALTLVHDRVHDPATRQQYHVAWQDCLDRLPDHL